MEKKIYLVTYQAFSAINGFDCAHAVDFQRDGEVKVFESKEDAQKWKEIMIEASIKNGWFISNEQNEFVEMKHLRFQWRIYFKVTEKKLY